MQPIKFATPFIAQTFIGLAGTTVAWRFSFLSRSAASVQALALLVASLLQSALQKNYQLKKGFYFLSFTAVTGVGALFKTSWKIHLLFSAVFTSLQFVLSCFHKANKYETRMRETQKQSTPPIEVRFSSSVDHPSDSAKTYLQLDINAVDMDQTLVPPPAELTFCIDTSSSMRGPRLDKVKKVLTEVLTEIDSQLKNDKDFNIRLSLVTFSDSAQVLKNKAQVDPKTIPDLQRKITLIEASGGTSILKGLETATATLEDSNGIQGSVGNLLRWGISCFATPLKTAQVVHHCTKSLVFLTDGDDIVDKASLRRLQEKWTSQSVNLFAIGISRDHKKDVMEQIVSNDQNQLLPNALYQWVPDKEDEMSTEGVSLEEAVNAIFHQTLSQTIQSISVQPLSIDSLELLNGHREKDGSFQLGGLATGMTMRKLFYGIVPTESEVSFNLSTTTLQGIQVHLFKTPLSSTYDVTVHREGVKQRIVAMHQQFNTIYDREERHRRATPLLEEAFLLLNSEGSSLKPDQDLRALTTSLQNAAAEQISTPDHDDATRFVRVARGRLNQT